MNIQKLIDSLSEDEKELALSILTEQAYKKSELEEIKSEKEQRLFQKEQAFQNIFLNEKLPCDIINIRTQEIVIPAYRKITRTLCRKMAVQSEFITTQYASPIARKIVEIHEKHHNK